MPSPSSSLRIAVLGAGNIGSSFAFQLARAGLHDVTVIARPESGRLKQLQRDQAIIDVNGVSVGVRITDRLDEATPFDLLIVTMPAHQADDVLPGLSRSSAKCILFLLNTFSPERLEQAVGVGRCAFGMPFVQAKLQPDGKLNARIGTAGQKTLLSEQRWVDVFNAAELPSALEADMPLWLRCHVPLCVAFESVSVAGMRRGGGASWGEALALARGIHASFALIEALGHPVYPRAKRLMGRSPASALAAMLWSLSRVRSFRELLTTGKAEAIALVDSMVAAAPIATAPFALSLIKGMRPV